jgi:hypothetical protein
VHRIHHALGHIIRYALKIDHWTIPHFLKAKLFCGDYTWSVSNIENVGHTLLAEDLGTFGRSELTLGNAFCDPENAMPHARHQTVVVTHDISHEH